MHDLRAVVSQLGHFRQRGALDRSRRSDAPRIGGHRAAYVGVDVHALRFERMSDSDRRKIRAAAAERRHRAILCDPLKSGDHGNRSAFQQLADRVWLDAENRCVAGALVGYDTRLTARKRHGGHAFGA
jgi:hypothetical protein